MYGVVGDAHRNIRYRMRASSCDLPTTCDVTNRISMFTEYKTGRTQALTRTQ